METFTEKITSLKQKFESALDAVLPRLEGPEARIIEAARYSLFAGGKRLRPIMALATGTMFGIPHAEILPFACALEMIHTYSLIHDDLPCMDDDDLRRGQPACHRQYDEATAVLAGDWLLTAAFEHMLAHCAADPIRTGARVAAARRVGRNAGIAGMLGGQAIDLWSVNHKIGEPLLERMHQMKTGAMFGSSLLIVLDLRCVSRPAADAIERYADRIGLQFQIQDDMLDATATTTQLGKSSGKDARDQKSTYVTLFGMDGARARLETSYAQAQAALDELETLKYDTSFFRSLTSFLTERDH